MNGSIDGPHRRALKSNPVYLGIASKEIEADEEQLKMNLEWLANRRQAKEDQS